MNEANKTMFTQLHCFFFFYFFLPSVNYAKPYILLLFFLPYTPTVGKLRYFFFSNLTSLLPPKVKKKNKKGNSSIFFFCSKPLVKAAKTTMLFFKEKEGKITGNHKNRRQNNR